MRWPTSLAPPRRARPARRVGSWWIGRRPRPTRIGVPRVGCLKHDKKSIVRGPRWPEEESMGVAPDLKTLADKMALTELVARLEQAVDRMDREGILACYSPRSFDDHGRWRGSGEEFA